MRKATFSSILIAACLTSCGADPLVSVDSTVESGQRPTHTATNRGGGISIGEATAGGDVNVGNTTTTTVNNDNKTINNDTTTVITPPRPPTFDETWEKVGSTQDRSGEDVVSVEGHHVRKGESVFVELAQAKTELFWNGERCANDPSFNAFRITRASTGRLIDWEFFRRK